ncbi:type VI secretion system protein TssA [Telluria aromaticivorans]|uniref:Type VI secretion system protein TssA n=1 Tax=Telluria aromaticivorans TaxID=2725995 RepID=A0A7Y2NZR6_9BURK|nr:type VI secretion system protein TssA [Telluria aromaticivorans]NNG23364.1 type VI secretion system protein TssA [Telluria aromaticivorans]
MLNVDKLLVPISMDRPCGEDLAFSPDVDAINRARQADDPSIEQGAWVTTLKEADWKFVSKRCIELLEARSKHLQLAVWLAEASARTAGLRGLAGSLRLVAGLCERYWDGAHPLPDEDGHERRIGNLAWIAARIAPLVKEVPVADGVTMIAWEAARARGLDAVAELEAARSRAPAAARQALLLDAEDCIAALAELERVVDERLGADGPSFGAGRAALRDLADMVAPPSAPAAAIQVQPAAQGTAVAMAPGISMRVLDGPLQSREQALAQLRGVAEFFRRTEPHSPVAYLAERAARWGEQPLHAWLRSVIKDDASLARLEDLLGIEAEG